MCENTFGKAMQQTHDVLPYQVHVSLRQHNHMNQTKNPKEQDVSPHYHPNQDFLSYQQDDGCTWQSIQDAVDSCSALDLFPLEAQEQDPCPILARPSLWLNSEPRGSGLWRMKEICGSLPVFVVCGRHADIDSAKTMMYPAATFD
jgi:hypothetical protein